jgi:hypothetical protein
MASIDHKNLGKFYRVQTTGSHGKAGTFVTRNAGSGKVTITMNSNSYESAKRAAAKVIKGKQPA